MAYAQRVTLLLSGGADSVVLAHDLVRQGMDVDALHFRFFARFGRPALRSARQTCERLNIPLKIVDLGGVARLMVTLVPGATLAADEYDTGNEDATVPSAMLLLPAVAAMYSQAAGRAAVYLGVIKNQLDRNPAIAKMIEQFPSLLAAINPRIAPVALHTPYIDLDKVAVLRRGISLGVPLEETWSCLDTVRTTPCGECAQCRERAQAFAEARVAVGHAPPQCAGRTLKA